MEKNDKEAKTNNETRKHVLNVVKYISIIASELLKRAYEHDASKMESPELEAFTEVTEKLAGCTYGSEEYKGFLKELKPCLDHHYARNRHHPKHFKGGIEDMTLIDLAEMLADWKSATLRHNDGNMLKSIEHNSKRFDIAPQLAKILQNTAEMFEHKD